MPPNQLKKYRQLLALIVILLGLAPFQLPANADSDPVSKADVLNSIKVMMDKPLTDEMVEAQKVVVKFADESNDVGVLIDPAFYKAKESDMEVFFLSYYIAGAVKYQLENPSKSGKPYASIPAAIRSELFIYKEVKKRLKGYQNDFYEHLADLDKQGKLEDFVLQKARESAASKTK
jgi:hypothetical protein